jgi:hypothetical protein
VKARASLDELTRRQMGGRAQTEIFLPRKLRNQVAVPLCQCESFNRRTEARYLELQGLDSMEQNVALLLRPANVHISCSLHDSEKSNGMATRLRNEPPAARQTGSNVGAHRSVNTVYSKARHTAIAFVV